LGPKSGFAAGAQLKAKPLDMRLGGNALLLSRMPATRAMRRCHALAWNHSQQAMDLATASYRSPSSSC